MPRPRAGANDLAAARKVADRLAALYAGRDELRWGRDRFAERRGDIFDADALFDLAEAELLAPLDAAARIEVEGAARQVAVVTAVVPLALADVLTALASNLRMIRRIAEIYGGRGGTLEAWRLTRAVMTHLVATGAVAVGDDLLGSIGGGHVLSRVSRRFGEGVVNGALTARVGIAAMEVCRPLPFHGQRKPACDEPAAAGADGLLSAELAEPRTPCRARPVKPAGEICPRLQRLSATDAPWPLMTCRAFDTVPRDRPTDRNAADFTRP